MLRRILPVLLGSAALVAAAVPLAHAQTVTGTVMGRVADATGGVLPGVVVTVESPQLIGGAQSRTTGAEGEYRVPALPPGSYTVTFALPGFTTYKRERIILEAGSTQTVDATLAPASMQ